MKKKKKKTLKTYVTVSTVSSHKIAKYTGMIKTDLKETRIKDSALW